MNGGAEGGTPGPVAPRWAVLAACGLSGAAVMSVEMTAVRALQPFFGATTVVWTNVIAVVLAALAGGYALGGRLADRRATPALLAGILGAGGILVAAGAALVTPASRLFLGGELSVEGMASLLGRGSLGASLLVFAPPMLVLGAASPVAVRLLADGGAGRASGGVLAASTAGSIAGTYLPTLVLVPWLGSRGALLFAAGLLLVPAAAGLAAYARPRRAGIAGALAALLAGGGVAAAADLRPARGTPALPGGGTSVVLAERESPYQYLTVRDDAFPGEPPWRVLTINEGVHTFHSLRVEGRVLTGSRCYDDYSLLPLLLDLPPGSALRVASLGFACGVDAAQWRHFWDGPYRLEISGAELDPEVLALGREFFGLRDDAGPGAVAADARPWLEALPPGERFDLVVVDCFAHEVYVPFHLATAEFFARCRDRLAPGGLLAMNCYAVGEDAPHLAAVENTLATVFGACLRLRQHGGTNFLLVARAGGPAPDPARLDPALARGRFGRRRGLADWDLLLEAAVEARADAATVVPRAGAPVLTDDHAPLESLTDRFLREQERRFLAGGPAPGGDGGAGDEDRRARFRAVAAAQDRALLATAAAWIAAAAGATVLARRGGPAGTGAPGASSFRPGSGAAK